MLPINENFKLLGDFIKNNSLFKQKKRSKRNEQSLLKIVTNVFVNFQVGEFCHAILSIYSIVQRYFESLRATPLSWTEFTHSSYLYSLRIIAWGVRKEEGNWYTHHKLIALNSNHLHTQSRTHTLLTFAISACALRAASKELLL